MACKQAERTSENPRPFFVGVRSSNTPLLMISISDISIRPGICLAVISLATVGGPTGTATLLFGLPTLEWFAMSLTHPGQQGQRWSF